MRRTLAKEHEYQDNVTVLSVTVASAAAPHAVPPNAEGAAPLPAPRRSPWFYLLAALLLATVVVAWWLLRS